MSNNQCKLVPFTEYAKLRGNDKNYQDALEASSLFNKRLLKDRKMRMPFIDSQTRMAQSNTTSWYRYQRRTPNELKNEASSNNALAFVYSNKKWIKKRRLNIDPNDHTLFPYAYLYRSQTNQQDQNQNSTVTFTINNNYLNENSNSMESITLQTQQQQQHSSTNSSLYQMLTKQSSQSNENENENDTQAYSQYHEDSYDNFDNDHDNSDEDDYEESKKKKKRGGKQKKKNDLLVNVDEKPYVCDKCGIKYKTKPGLSYHIQKTHNNTNNNNVNNNNSNSINSMNLNSSSTPNMSNSHQKDIDENTSNSIFESGYEDTSSSLPHVSSYQGQSMYNHHS